MEASGCSTEVVPLQPPGTRLPRVEARGSDPDPVLLVGAHERHEEGGVAVAVEVVAAFRGAEHRRVPGLGGLGQRDPPLEVRDGVPDDELRGLLLRVVCRN
jgi:hypothetical protein